uniref:GRIP domain-containing protein n=1 Tax=Mesocestoides corti TaxID=53468 RepID=A0A5K3FMW7_MESCO
MRLSELLEEKSLQEAESKNQLTKLLKDKEVALQRVRDLERTLEDLKEECAYLQGEYTSAQDACSNISDEYKTNLTTISQRVNELTTERNQLHEQLVQANQENTALKEHCEQISHELGVTKEMYEQAKLKATGFANGLPDTEDSNKGLSSVLASKEVDGEINSCKDIDAELVQNQPVEPTCDEEVLVESSKSEANEYISDSIRDFHQALELIRILDAKISALAPTTDLDFATSEEVKPEEPSGVTACSANPSAVVDASSLSSSSIEPLVKRIVRHNEAAMTSLHAYLRQVNPLAAAELINKIC